MERLDGGVSHAQSGMEWEGTRLYHVTQNGMQLKTYELFISGMFHLIFWTTVDHG